MDTLIAAGDLDIAIIGVVGRFPGAKGIDEFWQNLRDGIESISFFSDEELEEAGIDPHILKDPNYVKAKGILKDVDLFDASFFGLYPREAELLDPQQRIFLECAWEALEDAGYDAETYPGLIGVFGGVGMNTGMNTYLSSYLSTNQEHSDSAELYQLVIANDKDFLTTRVSYKLNLKGPSIDIQSACSTSLVAVHVACQNLLNYSCDMALAGGVSVAFPQKSGYLFQEGMILSPDGHCRTFDAKAAGTSGGNGAGIVVLKRLADALADGDYIYAVIKGSAVNNDGSMRVGYTAPGVDGQAKVIAMAQAVAGVVPETISYIEAHGTGTTVGDPIEITALTQVFREKTDAKGFCAIGSVKTNIGHLDAAAGVTGLIKTVLALKHKLIPPSLHFERPNPKIDLENSPFYVNSTLSEWKNNGHTPRRAGVSSFGIGGTNAHVVLEEAPVIKNLGNSRPWQLLVLSAKTDSALETTTTNLAAHLKRHSDLNIADVAYTLQIGRKGFNHRRIIVCQSHEDALTTLENQDPKRIFTASHPQKPPNSPLVFMFSGQGAQYVNMGRQLYEIESTFRDQVDYCSEFLKPHLGLDLRNVLYPPKENIERTTTQQLNQTRYTQPALFVIEYALAQLWMSWGIKPAAMIGHSVGEYVAACLAGVFSLEDTLRLVARRAEFVQAQPGGRMLAVRLPEKELLPLLNPELAIAAINSPKLCVVSGSNGAIEKFEAELDTKRIAAKPLSTSHAFHSPMMEPVLAPYRDLLAKVRLGEPQIPFVSNVTAQWISSDEAKNPDYWAAHVRRTVRFADGLAELLKDSRRVLLEVGPGQTLSTLARQHPAKAAEQLVFSSLPSAKDQEQRGVLETLGRLWMSGVEVDWQGFYANERRRRVVLPTYPFERKRYWLEPPKAQSNKLTVEDTRAAAPEQPQPTIAEPASATESTPVVICRKDVLLAETRSLLQDLSGSPLEGVDPGISFLELGLDSLLLTQAARLFQRKFGLKITVRQLMEELDSLGALTRYLDAKLPTEAFAPTVKTAPAIPSQSAPQVLGQPATSAADGSLEDLLRQQMQLTSELLRVLGKQTTSGRPAVEPTAPSQIKTVAGPQVSEASEIKAHGPFKPLEHGAIGGLSAGQQKHLEAFIQRYNRRTAGSKRLTQQNRPVLADPRSVAGFKQLWKEMVYPIVTSRSEGSKVWDVDENEYVDFVMGFGANLFGHRPPFVTDAVKQQLDRGFEIGPIQPLAGEVAALVRELTGMERVGFCSTGSEAVMAAIRVARTVTGRDKIAVFSGAYHGIFDEVLSRPTTVNGQVVAAPIAPGIPKQALENVLILDYGNEQSLEILRSQANEIAAVLVEPVQSRRLDLQPKEFLHQLRKVTDQAGIALVFDEVVTGFRVHPGGAQAYFGVQADLATYGKVVGGGLPIGLVTGKAKFMDALDSGQWEYGDASFPEVGVTFFAGTFVRHPLALAAAKAVLTHLKSAGPQLQQRLAARAEKTVGQLRSMLAEFNAPFHLTQFSSLFHLTYPPSLKFGGLLFYYLREHGIHMWENRVFVLTTAHTDADLEKLLGAFRKSLTEMKAARFLPETGLSASSAAQSDSVQRSKPAASAKGIADLRHEPFPLTKPQEEIWLATQMGGESALAYNESLSLRFGGAFDPELFRASVQHVLERHPILLASISADGQTQSVKPGTKVHVPLIDLTDVQEQPQAREVASLIEREGSEPFDLTAGPLVRVRMVRLRKDDHLVLWTAHHIVCDGWSGGLLVNELADTYSSLKKGQTPQLEPPVSFREYALQQAADDAALEGSLAFWRKQFSELPPPLELPGDRPRPLVRSGRAFTAKRSLDSSTYQDLKRLAAQHRSTVVAVLMTALKTLLYRFSGQKDLVIGLPAAGQAINSKPCLVGHCVNLLPIRTQLDPERSFVENLAAVKKNVLDAFDHQDCTLGITLQHLSIPRTPARLPLVEVLLNLDRDPGASEFEGLKFECERNPKHAFHFDLFFNFVEGLQGLYVECDYNTDIFDDSTAERWLENYETLLKSVAATPGSSLRKLPILTQAEERQLLVEWNAQSKRDYPRDYCIHQLVERQVEQSADNVAIIDGHRRVTYRDFNEKANRLAAHLRSLGAGPEVLVAVCMDRSAEMVITLLAILKAGGAYVPLDPNYPKDRVAFMLQDSRARVLITQRRLVNGLPAGDAQVVCIEDFDWEARAAEENIVSGVSPSNLAYVIYTSGSTGRPKGVAIEHRSAAVLMQWAWEVFQPAELTGVLFSTTICFDLSVFEMFVTLGGGGKVIVAQNALELPTLPARSEVTLINTVPSAMAELVRAKALPESVQVVNLIGELLKTSLVNGIYALGTVKKVYDLYGPSEDTVYSTFVLRKPEAPATIGRPIANTQAYILDADLQPVPIGVGGELFIGGEGLARGYLNHPKLTAEKFVENHLDKQVSPRLYRTGDLARFRQDGNIEFLGRIDHQVKIRGFRIELGEIEAVLGSHPGVKQCVVLAREDTPGEPRLVAYYAPESGEEVSDSALRDRLRQVLPAYMVPQYLIALKDLPLTLNGKVDRKALPPPEKFTEQNILGESAGSKIDKALAAPHDALELQLANIWRCVLGRPVGIYDNFFEIGGHSLLAVRIIVEIEKVYGHRLPLTTLLQAPTISELANVLRQENWKPNWRSLVPIRAGGSKLPLFLMHSHGGNVLEYYVLANFLGKDQPVYALQSRGLDGRIIKDPTVEEMAAAYLQELKSLQPKGPYFLAGFCFGGLLALEAAQQLSTAGEEVGLVVLIQTSHPHFPQYQPGTGPLRRLWYRAQKRLQLERDNLAYRGTSYIVERLRRVGEIALSRAEIRLDEFLARSRENPSLRYVLESLSIEHDKAFFKYKARPYSGPVVLLRARQQLSGIVPDPYLGWKPYLNGHLESVEIPGHQQNIMIEPHVARLAEEMTKYLVHGMNLISSRNKEFLTLQA